MTKAAPTVRTGIATTDSRGRNRAQFQTVNTEPSKTVQSDAQLADINYILKQWSEVGIIDQLNMTEAMFMDVSDFTDFADAMNYARQAESTFMQLPSKVREIFNHDVAEWLDAAHDPAKRQALLDAGVVQSLGGSPGGDAAAAAAQPVAPEPPEPVVTEGNAP